jgi:hypothetical protein
MCVPSSTEHISRDMSFTIASNSSELLAEEMAMVGDGRKRGVEGMRVRVWVGHGDENREENRSSEDERDGGVYRKERRSREDEAEDRDYSQQSTSTSCLFASLTLGQHIYYQVRYQVLAQLYSGPEDPPASGEYFTAQTAAEKH